MRIDKPSIVLFEDEPIIELDLIRKLSRWGYQTILTADHIDLGIGLTGLSNCIIICNLRLSNGWVSNSTFEFLTKTELPTIILTGLSDTRLQGVDLEEMNISFVYKPFTSHQLKSTLNDIIYS